MDNLFATGSISVLQLLFLTMSTILSKDLMKLNHLTAMLQPALRLPVQIQSVSMALIALPSRQPPMNYSPNQESPPQQKRKVPENIASNNIGLNKNTPSQKKTQNFIFMFYFLSLRYFFLFYFHLCFNHITTNKNP